MEHSQINKTLLSAYIDGDVSEQERSFVEAAADNDPQTAWELETLQQTVRLLNGLSNADVPSFAELPKSLMFKNLRTNKPFPRKIQAAQQIFWQIGNPLWRNISIASLLLLITIVSGDLLFSFIPYLYQVLQSIVATFLAGIQSELAYLPKTPVTGNLNIEGIKVNNFDIHSSMGAGIQRSYLLFIYLVISLLTFMSTMLWWRSRPFH